MSINFELNTRSMFSLGSFSVTYYSDLSIEIYRHCCSTMVKRLFKYKNWIRD